MNNNLQAIILAAGKSTRFNTEKTKLAADICGQAMILFPTKLLHTLHIPTTVVVGYQQETVKEIITRRTCRHHQFCDTRKTRRYRPCSCMHQATVGQRSYSCHERRCSSHHTRNNFLPLRQNI